MEMEVWEWWGGVSKDVSHLCGGTLAEEWGRIGFGGGGLWGGDGGPPCARGA